MDLTKKAIETLLTMPPSETSYSDDEREDEREAWDVEQHSDGLLEVKYDRFSIRGYQRFVTPDGEIQRHNEETDEMVPATGEPLIGEYVTTSDGKTHKYRY